MYACTHVCVHIQNTHTHPPTHIHNYSICTHLYAHYVYMYFTHTEKQAKPLATAKWSRLPIEPELEKQCADQMLSKPANPPRAELCLANEGTGIQSPTRTFPCYAKHDFIGTNGRCIVLAIVDYGKTLLNIYC